MDLYIITIELDEDSIYFAELTPGQARELKRILEKGKFNFAVEKIREAAGFNSFSDLKSTFKDMVTP